MERERLIQEAIQKERQVFVEMPKQSLSSFEKNQENKVAVQEESRPFIFNTRPVSSMEQVQTNSYVSFDNGEGNSANLSKIEGLVKDNSIVSIDCPGPGKFIILRNTLGRQVITKSVLMKEDIDSVLNYFSNETRIPRIGGIFKAIIGNLVITAIDSDVAGPRFIITKIVQRNSNFI